MIRVTHNIIMRNKIRRQELENLKKITNKKFKTKNKKKEEDKRKEKLETEKCTFAASKMSNKWSTHIM